MSDVIVMSPDALARLVRDAVAEALAARPEPAGVRLLDREACAAWLGTSTRTVDNLRARGLPHVFVGDSPRFRPEEVLEWLASRSPAGVAGASRCDSSENQPVSHSAAEASGTTHRAARRGSKDLARLPGALEPRQRGER